MTVKLLTEHQLEFLSLKGSCTDSSEFTLVELMPHCWKSHVTAHYELLPMNEFFLVEGLSHKFEQLPLIYFNLVFCILKCI